MLNSIEVVIFQVMLWMLIRVEKIITLNSDACSELRQVSFDLRAGNSNLAKSLGERSNHAMYQDENPHRCLLSLQH